MKKISFDFKFNRILPRLLSFNIVLIVIVTALAQIIFYYFMLNNYREEQIAEVNYSVGKIRDGVDEAIFRQVYNISVAALNNMSDKDLLMYPMEQDIKETPYKMSEIAKELASIPFTYDFVSCVDIYYSRENLLFRGDHVFFMDEPGEDNRYPAWLKEIIHSEQSGAWMPVEDEETAFVYIRRYPYYTQSAKAIFVIEAARQALTDEIRKMKNVEGGYVCLITELGEPVLILEEEREALQLEEELVQKLCALEGDGFFEQRIGGEKYLVTYAASVYSPWKYLFIVPEGNVFSGVVNLMLKVSCFGILYMLVSLAATVLLTKRANSPMEVVLKNMEAYIERENEAGKGDVNQYELIENTFCSLTVHVRELEEQLVANRPVIYKNMIDRFLNGNSQSMYHDARIFNFEKAKFSCFMVLIYYQEELEMYNRMLLDYSIVEYMNTWNHAEDIYVATDEKDLVYGILNFSGEAALGSEGEKIYEKLRSYISVPFILCLGRPVEREEDIHRSYQDVLRIREYAFFCKDKKVLCHEDLPSGSLDSTDGLEEYIERLGRELQGGRTDNIRELLGLISEGVSSGCYTEGYCMNTLMDTIFTIRKAMLALGRDEEVLFGGDIRQQMKNIRHITEYEKWLEELVESIEISLSDEKREVADELRARIESYVEENIFCDITLYKLSDSLGLSSSYLSRIFKSLMGMNYTDYLFQVKMKKALELLSDTDYTVKEIGEKLGYTSSAHFIKIFKSRFGMTPKQMRISRL